MSPAAREWTPDWLRGEEDANAFDLSWPLWRPTGLAEADPRELAYIVVDDLADDTAVLAVSVWPRLDPERRLRFPVDERPRLVRVETDELMSILREQRRRFADRPLRIGDVFAACARLPDLPPPASRAEQAQLEAEEPPPGSLAWLEPPVFDLTAQGREAAKAALAAAVSPLLSDDDVRALTAEKRSRGTR